MIRAQKEEDKKRETDRAFKKWSVFLYTFFFFLEEDFLKRLNCFRNEKRCKVWENERKREIRDQRKKEEEKLLYEEEKKKKADENFQKYLFDVITTSFFHDVFGEFVVVEILNKNLESRYNVNKAYNFVVFLSW